MRRTPSLTETVPLGSLSLPWSLRYVYHLLASLPSNRATGSLARAGARVRADNTSRPRKRVMGCSGLCGGGVVERAPGERIAGVGVGRKGPAGGHYRGVPFADAGPQLSRTVQVTGVVGR